jgi:hypothetical protein
MKDFAVNGFRKESPLAEELPFQDLLAHIRKTYTTEGSLISSILVNGIELEGDDEKMLERVPIAQIKTLEVHTQHPREVAEETLQNLVGFTSHLEAVCLKLAAAETLNLAELVDGIRTFVEALDSAKRILRITRFPATDLLETDLSSIFRDLAVSQEKGDIIHVGELLNTHLRTNIVQWREEGIPALIRSRDS